MAVVEEVSYHRKLRVLDKAIKNAYNENYMMVVDRLLEERFKLWEDELRRRAGTDYQ